MIPFDNTYARLPDAFFEFVAPSPVSDPTLIRVNHTLATELGIVLPEDESLLADWFSGNRLPKGAQPLAMAYAGHQFGHFVHQLGDGRAILLGEVLDRNGHRRDLQLKGAGRTRFSRGGDGRAAVGPVLREYIVSEAMHTMGVPTTRALAMVRTGDPVYRETPLPGAILTRVASSHIRVGTFEYFAARQDTASIQTLADYVIQRHYPWCAEAANPILAMLTEIMKAQARLVAHWMHLGFIHGVMNTDNTTVSGETIDYGPCAFMDHYQHDKVFSSIDQYSRYAYKNQPLIARWNLENLSACLAPLLAATTEEAVEHIKGAVTVYADTFEHHWKHGFVRKIGLACHADTPTEELNKRFDLVQRLLSLMNRNRTDFTNTFRYLGDEDAGLVRFRAVFPATATAEVDEWIADWKAAIPRDEARTVMNRANPAYIPRNHRIEEAIVAALHGDMGPADRLMQVLADPFTENDDYAAYMQPPAPDEVVERTFCGT